MGCYSPVPEVTSQLLEKVKSTILLPAVTGMRKNGIEYEGVLNLNAIIRNGTEEPLVLEFNARFGDPEGQGVMMLVENGLAKHLVSIAENAASRIDVPKTRVLACVVVVLASKEYPTTPSIGDRITIRPFDNPKVKIFHAGTSQNSAGELVTSGGRVLNVACVGTTLESAREEVYGVIRNTIGFDAMHFRSDIGRVEKKRQRTLPVTPQN